MTARVEGGWLRVDWDGGDVNVDIGVDGVWTAAYHDGGDVMIRPPAAPGIHVVEVRVAGHPTRVGSIRI